MERVLLLSVDLLGDARDHLVSRAVWILERRGAQWRYGQSVQSAWRNPFHRDSISISQSTGWLFSQWKLYSSFVAKFSKHFVHMYSTLFILNDRGITAVLPWCCVCCTAVVSACFVETFTCVCDVIFVDCPFVAGALLHGNSVVAVSTYWALSLKFRWWCFHRVFSVFFHVWPVPLRFRNSLG